MTTDLDHLLGSTGAGAATGQRIGWEYAAWCQTPQHSPHWRKVGPVLEDLEDRWSQEGGISRAAVVDIAEDDSLRLLVTSMVWGFGTVPYGPARVQTMLSTPHLTSELKGIAFAATGGAALGFAATPIVPICAHTQPFANSSATLPSKITELTASAVGNMVITTCAARTASWGDTAATAPASARGATAELKPSHTLTGKPAASNLRAIADPIIPAPSTATATWSTCPPAAAIAKPLSRG